MQSKEKDNLVIVVLSREEDIIEMIKETCKKHKIKTAIILSGIGQLKKVKLGYFKEKDNYTPQEFVSPLELLSLSGNICKDKDKHILHLHGVYGDEEKRAFGGHLIEGKVSVTAEIAILKTDLDVKRKTNKVTGLKNLFLE
jgi:hypothetical protein